MSQTLSKEKYGHKSSTHHPSGNQKTQKRKGKNRNVSMITKSSIWLNKQKIPIILQQNPVNEKEMEEECSWRDVNQQKFLHISNPPSIKINRARIIDWLLDVCRAFELRWESYWCAIELLDFLIFIIDFVRVANIHIVAVTCLFIGAKIHQTNPPLLERIIQKAVYHEFSIKDVLSMEAQILLWSANADTKPRYLTTVYNSLYEVYPKMPLKERVEALRRLVVIWMDPVMAIKGKNKSGGNILISYNDIVTSVVRGMQENEDLSNLEKVRYYFKEKYECDNVDPLWPGFDKIRM